eukprot:SAG22_NODE_331_length_12174_cov_12.920497_4_plen_124_part_00
MLGGILDLHVFIPGFIHYLARILNLGRVRPSKSAGFGTYSNQVHIRIFNSYKYWYLVTVSAKPADLLGGVRRLATGTVGAIVTGAYTRAGPTIRRPVEPPFLPACQGKQARLLSLSMQGVRKI